MFKSRKRKYNAIGINIYGGAFTLGVMRHFDVLGQWEEIDLGKRTFDLNFKGIYRPLDINHWPTKDYTDKINFVYANPPCAPWSSANTFKGKTIASRFNDQRLTLTKHTYEAALSLRPEIFIAESVENAYNHGASHYDQYIEMWLKAGYAVTFFMNDAILQGAPCMRRRFHFIAHRHKLMLGRPPTSNVKITTAGDVLGDLVELNDQLPHHDFRLMHPWIKKIAENTKPGEPLRKAVPRVTKFKGDRVGIGFLVKRIKWDRPTFTIVGNSFVHPLTPRWLTMRELMRLGTYPDDFNSKWAIDVADAVIPTVAEFLALIAKRTIQKAESCPVEYNFIDWRPLAKDFHINSKNYPQ